jgi:hypothetical protein
MPTFTQAQVDAAKAAMLANPFVRSMKYGDKEFSFATAEEMAQFVAYMQRNIDGGATGGVRYAATSKGV